MDLIALDCLDAEVGKVLSCKSRLEILNSLSKGKKTVAQISEETGLSCMTVRFHLKTLIKAGIVKQSDVRRSGHAGRPSIYYELARSLTIISFPPRHYYLLSYAAISALKEVLGELKAKSALYKIGIQLGQHLKDELEKTLRESSWSIDCVVSNISSILLKMVGVIAEPLKFNDNEIIFRFYNCPFEEIAKNFSSMVCEGFDKGLYEGFSIYSSDKGIRWRRLKSVTKGDDFCEFVLSFVSSQEVNNVKKTYENNINNYDMRKYVPR